jgi:hypothetical protein
MVASSWMPVSIHKGLKHGSAIPSFAKEVGTDFIEKCFDCEEGIPERTGAVPASVLLERIRAERAVRQGQTSAETNARQAG